MNLSPKVRKTLDIATRLTIAVLSLSYIFYRVFTLSSGQVNTFVDSVKGGQDATAIAFILIVMMVINWGIESYKWKMLIGQAEVISFSQAFQAILGGLAVSVFTPNRVGEFLGRVFILRKTDPFKSIMFTIVGSFSQLLVTIILGTLAYVFFAPLYLPSVLFETTWIVKGLSVTLVTVSLILILIYFNISVLHRIRFIVKAKYAIKIKNGIDAIADFPKKLLLKTVLLSASRYLVFATQFYLSVKLMGLNFNLIQCMMVIPVIYLVLAAIPTVALTELGVRGSVSVFFFGLLSGAGGLDANATLAIVSASSLVWLINIAVPSLAGVLVVFRLKFFRR